VALLAELPDLWDVNVGGSLGNDSRSSRFSQEGFQEPHVAFVKSVTSKPVVGVGRFTSPDVMVAQVKRGVLDFIGAARPSIADPFLPRKIAEGREDEIRECIGCNICRAANNEAVPLRCTQNPTIGEEWRRGWHPETMPRKTTDEGVVIVGGGPAGLECALALGRRGHEVMLAEAQRELGGRVVREASLPGLSQWIRVRDHRQHMLGKLANVSIFRESPMSAVDLIELNVPHVVIATGSLWRRDGVGAIGLSGAEIAEDQSILTPDDIFAGAALGSSILVYDDEHYSMAGALAESLLGKGRKVALVTPEAQVSSWTLMTDEQAFIQKRLMEIGVELRFRKLLARAAKGTATFTCIYTGREEQMAFDSLVLVTGRLPDDRLYHGLMEEAKHQGEAGLRSITRIGDCLAPSSIGDAVYQGHKFARGFGLSANEEVLRRERPPVQ
jgi:dimethylamine/trimethylamine dehydrogenase